MDPLHGGREGLTASTTESRAHVAQFYEDERCLCDSVATFIGDGLEQGQPALVIATEPHWRAFQLSLAARGADVRNATRAAQLTFVDAHELLGYCMRDGMPDSTRVKQHIGEAVAGVLARKSSPTLRMFGEMVDLLWRDGNSQAALRLEELWNDMIGLYPLKLLCAYDITNFNQSADIGPLLRICDRHQHTIPAESFREDWDDDQRQRALLKLQQRARAFESEVAQRKALEHALRTTLSARRVADREHSEQIAEAETARAELARLAHAAQDHRALIDELRPSLSSIMSWTKTAAGEPDAAALRQAVDAIEVHAQVLSRLLDGVRPASGAPAGSDR